MKKNFLILSIFMLCAATLSAQKHNFIHPSIFEVRFSLSDYKSNKPFASPSTMQGGLGVSFTKGINNHFDWSINLDASYADSILKKSGANKEKTLLLQGDVSVRARMFGSETAIQPYVLTGFGFTKYKNYFNAYIPTGLGIQVSLFKDAYLLSNVQYRIPLGNNFNDHFFYSIGLAGTVARRKPKPIPQKQVTLPPMQTVARDRDNDGIVDTADACPDHAGLTIFKGCPDSDNDGIPNMEDKCPSVAGFLKYSGCPIPDTDKDGINDENDSCITVPGYAKYHGCPIPDRDADGVNDEEDKCIDIPGIRQNAGCPQIKKEIKDIIDLAASQIYFRTGSAELLPASYISLDKVAKILSEEPSVKLSIEGHTDNVGTPQSNQLLSERRAQSVLQYLKTKGIPESRLTARGFGQEKPVTGNNSTEGRATNRRVELLLSY